VGKVPRGTEKKSDRRGRATVCTQRSRSLEGCLAMSREEQ